MLEFRFSMVRFQEELIKKLNLLWQLLSVGGRGRGGEGRGLWLRLRQLSPGRWFGLLAAW